MEENCQGQPNKKPDDGTLQQNHEANSLPAEIGVHLSDQFENTGNLAQSVLESVKETNCVQNLTGSLQKLFPKNFQNLTGSALFEDSFPQSHENNRSRPFSSRGNGDSQNDPVFQEEQSPKGTSFTEYDNSQYQPYQSKSSRYPPWQGQCRDMPFESLRNDSEVDNIKQKKGKYPYPGGKREKKEKKSVSTKTFAHGMMDVSLLTSNATQLRAVLSYPEYEFYTLLLWLIGLSIVLQILSAVLLIMSDFFKTQVKEKDRQNQGKRKLLNFLSLTLVTIVMSLNVLISAFSAPSYPQHLSQQKAATVVPVFSSSNVQGARSEL